MIEILLDSAFAEAQIVGDLLVGFGFGNEGNNLLFPEGQGMTRFADGSYLRSAASRADVLLSPSVKAVPAASATTRHWWAV
jgi:hypothetical protein